MPSDSRTPAAPARATLALEIRRAFVALGFFTRVPIPAWVGWSADELGRAARYFPLVGVFVGVVGAVVLLIASELWPLPVAAVLSMTATVLVTGAFHEDGLADSADGFGGGYTRERVLEIMQDSRIGAFGALALILALSLKLVAVLELSREAPVAAALALVVAHTASRAVALGVMAALPYVRVDGPARAKPVAEGIGPREWTIGLAIGALPAVLAWHFGVLAVGDLIAINLACFAVWLAATRYLRARLGGYAGDALGATQQLAELAIYLALLAGMP